MYIYYEFPLPFLSCTSQGWNTEAEWVEDKHIWVYVSATPALIISRNHILKVYLWCLYLHWTCSDNFFLSLFSKLYFISTISICILLDITNRNELNYTRGYVRLYAGIMPFYTVRLELWLLISKRSFGSNSL